MSKIPSSAMPHAVAAPAPASAQPEGTGRTIKAGATKLADKARANPKTSLAVGAAVIVGAVAAAVAPLARGLKGKAPAKPKAKAPAKPATTKAPAKRATAKSSPAKPATAKPAARKITPKPPETPTARRKSTPRKKPPTDGG